MNRDGINKTIFWSLLYIFLYSACTVIANLYLPNVLLITVGVSGIIYIIFNLFFIPYKREKLFVNGIFGALAVMFIGIWLGISPSSAIKMFYSQIVLKKGMPFELKLPSSKPLAVGAMTREQLDAELQKGVNSIKAGKVYSADEVDAALAKEFGIL